MNWSLGFKQKMKAVGLLFGAMNLILFTALSLRHSLKEMDQTVTSVYADRLQPAVDLVYLSENLHAKRHLLETYLIRPTSGPDSGLSVQLNNYNRATEELIRQFEQTRLTADEARQWQTFKSDLSHYNRLERNILQMSGLSQGQPTIQLCQKQGAVYFQQSVRALHALARIQAKTGRQAMEAAHREASGGSLNTTLLIALSILIGLLLLGLIHTARLMHPYPQPFHLN